MIITALNQFLALDPETPLRLKKLAGKSLQIQVLGFTPFYLEFSSSTFNLVWQHEGAVNATIQGTPLAFLKYFSTLPNQESKLSSDLTITGDIETVHEVGELLQHLDIDWEEQLAKFTGDVIAHSLGNATRNISGWRRNTLALLTTNLSEYLQEELRLVPPQEEADDFYSDIAILRNDVERAEMRIMRLISIK